MRIIKSSKPGVIHRRDFLTGCGCMAASSLLPHGVRAEESPIFKNRICGFSGRLTGQVKNLGPASDEAVKITTWITDSIGIRQNFKIMAADIERYAKAFATIRNGQRYIVYDRKAFDWSAGQASWDDISTMGHEVGHHIASHVFANEYSGHEQELEADRFSGFAMFKLGATLEQATAEFWDWPATQWHPGGLKRKAAVADGWKHAQKMQQAEGERCQEGWSGGTLDIDGTACRMVRRCAKRGPVTELACKDYEGHWRWKR